MREPSGGKENHSYHKGQAIMRSCDTGRYLENITNQPRWKQLAFMACCCERMLPNYRVFSDETGWGVHDVLESALDACWNYIEADVMPPAVIEVLQQCEAQAPNMEDFPSEYTSPALDAAVAIATLVEGTLKIENQSADVEQVATLARDTIDMYLQFQEDLDPNDPDLDRKILSNNLMRREVDAQINCIDLLSHANHDRASFVRELRASCRRSAHDAPMLIA